MVGGTPASFTTNTGRHDIAVILLKVALNTKQSINQSIFLLFTLNKDITVIIIYMYISIPM
jgi:hypothetical protein